MNIDEKEISKADRDIDLSGFEVQDELNPKIWDDDQNMKPEVRKTLLKIADDYFESLDLPNIDIEDVTMTGSLSNYNWSKYSDVDLHILVDYTELPMQTDLVRDFFKSKTDYWNDEHEVKIYGYDVEIYIQDVNEPHHSTGIYSVLKNEWSVKPEKKKINIDNSSVKEKSELIMDKIEDIYDGMDDVDNEVTIERVKKLTEKIKKMRQSGLETGGEYSVENIVFKVLRRNGMLDRLYDIKTVAYDKSVTLESEKLLEGEFDWIEELDPTPLGPNLFKELSNYFKKNKNNFRYKDFTYYMDGMSGAITWVQDTQDDYVFYATPFWNDEDDLTIEYAGDMGEYDTIETIDLPEFTTLEELTNWMDNEYPKIVYKEIIHAMGWEQQINEVIEDGGKKFNLKNAFKKISNNFTRFLSGLKTEREEVKEAYKKLVSAIKEKRELTPEEKREIGNKLKDLLKLTGFTAASVLPGGLIYLLIARVSFMKKHMIPKSFLEDKTEIKESDEWDWARKINPIYEGYYYIDISDLDVEGKRKTQKRAIDLGFKWLKHDGYVESLSRLNDKGYLLYNEDGNKLLYRTTSTYSYYINYYNPDLIYITADEFLNLTGGNLTESDEDGDDFEWVRKELEYDKLVPNVYYTVSRDKYDLFIQQIETDFNGEVRWYWGGGLHKWSPFTSQDKYHYFILKNTRDGLRLTYSRIKPKESIKYG